MAMYHIVPPRYLFWRLEKRSPILSVVFLPTVSPQFSGWASPIHGKLIPTPPPSLLSFGFRQASQKNQPLWQRDIEAKHSQSAGSGRMGSQPDGRFRIHGNNLKRRRRWRIQRKGATPTFPTLPPLLLSRFPQRGPLRIFVPFHNNRLVRSSLRES